MGEMKQQEHRVTMSPGGSTEVKPQVPIHRRRKCRICCGVSVVVVLALVIVIVALSQTIFKFKDPNITLNSVKVENLNIGLNILQLSAVLNITLGVDVEVQNPNHYSFKFENTTMLMTYHSGTIGDIGLGAGEIRAEKSVNLPARITVEALNIVENSNVIPDVTSGVFPVSITATIPGRVNLANIYKHHVIVTIDCALELWIGNQTVKDQVCSKHVKL